MAYHYDAGGLHEQAVESYEMAATAASEVYANQEAIRHLHRAIALASASEQEVRLLTGLHQSLAESLAFIGRYPEAFETYQSALKGIPGSDWDACAAISISEISRWDAVAANRYRPNKITLENRRILLDHEMRIGDPVKIAGAHFGYTFVLLWHGDLSLARQHFTEALSLAEKVAYGLRYT